MNREEHLKWDKARAIGCVERGNLVVAHTSMLSDLSKHPDTQQSQAMHEWSVKMLLDGNLSTKRQMIEWIHGFH